MATALRDEVALVGGQLPAIFSTGRPEFRRSGAVIARLLEPARLARLQQEALSRHAAAVETRVEVPRDDRAGEPDRWLESAAGGPELNELYRSAETLSVLRDVTGVSWQQSGPAGSYSYYRREGHHLGLHRDIDICELAVITCLVDDAQGDPGTGGTLLLYPSRSGDSLAAIRRSPEDGALGVRLQPGQTLILLGGLVPHRLLPLGPGHVRIISPLCYRVRRD